MVHKLVDDAHMAFIWERNILDVALITNECLNTRQEGNLLGVQCKLDIEKVSDHINSSFLTNMLKEGFDSK